MPTVPTSRDHHLTLSTEKRNTKWRPSEVIATSGRTKSCNISLNGKDIRRPITPGSQKIN
jgi:hypothetical protein